MFELSVIDHAEDERDAVRQEFTPRPRFCPDCGRSIKGTWHQCQDQRPDRPRS